jgi:hypothetical protein
MMTRDAPHPWNSNRFSIGSSSSGIAGLFVFVAGVDAQSRFGLTVLRVWFASDVSKPQVAWARFATVLGNCCSKLRKPQPAMRWMIPKSGAARIAGRLCLMAYDMSHSAQYW